MSIFHSFAETDMSLGILIRIHHRYTDVHTDKWCADQPIKALLDPSKAALEAGMYSTPHCTAFPEGRKDGLAVYSKPLVTKGIASTSGCEGRHNLYMYTGYKLYSS